LLDDGEGLRGEGFVSSMTAMSLSERPASFNALDGLNGTDAELFRENAGGGIRDEAREGLEAKRFWRARRS